MHGGSRSNQQYKRSPLQLANLAQQKKGGRFGGRFSTQKIAAPAVSWWTCPESEWKAAHTAQVPRMTAVTTTYRFAHPEDF